MHDESDELRAAFSSAGHLRSPGPLWMSPVDPFEHIAELCGGNSNHTIRRRRPDEATALQTLGVKRHAQPVVPKDLQQVTPLAAEHIQIASMRIALQRLLDLQGKPVHATAHVRGTCGQPDPHTGWRCYHPRSAATTRRKAARLTS